MRTVPDADTAVKICRISQKNSPQNMDVVCFIKLLFWLDPSYFLSANPETVQTFQD